MGIGSRPATCASCGKRLSRKQWYYRNGQYFCKRRCWLTEREKAAEKAAKEAAQAKPSAGGEPAPEATKPPKPAVEQQPAKEAPAAS